LFEFFWNIGSAHISIPDVRYKIVPKFNRVHICLGTHLGAGRAVCAMASLPWGESAIWKTAVVQARHRWSTGKIVTV
jgi:hypothetical protein